jgi:hypothetical protein
VPHASTLPIRERPSDEPESHARRNVIMVVALVALVLVVASVLGVVPAFGGRSVTVVDSNIDVLVTSCRYYQVDVPLGGTSVLQGSFKVLGGNGNQIQVLVMSSAAYSGFKQDCGVVAGGNSSYYFETGEENAGNFTVSLPPGSTCYLVYNNPQTYNNVLTTKVVLRTG